MIFAFMIKAVNGFWERIERIGTLCVNWESKYNQPNECQMIDSIRE
jgi:hypothetical protein